MATAKIEWSIEREESAWKVLDAAISRKKQIADSNFLLPPFTSSENMEVYTSVFNLCTMSNSKNKLDSAVYQKSIFTLQERIMENVIPRLLGKHGAELLNEVTQSWTEFKSFSDSLYKFFSYLDRYYTATRPSVKDVPRICFSDHVCERLYVKIQEAAMNLIIEERDGKDIDSNLLEGVLNLFLELGGKGVTDYYDKFVQMMLAEAAAYYSELSMEWWFWRDSYANYLRKVDQCLIQEEARAKVYPCQSTKTKLLDVMKYILLERNAKRWVQKQKTDGFEAEEKELISKYSSISLDVGSPAPATGGFTRTRAILD